MARPHVERRLAAILAADVAGYSRLMGVDEEGTHAALKEYRHEIIDPKIAEHRGRVVRIIGDGLLVEFASVIAAVRWAVEVQRAMGERNAGLSQEKRIEFRMGINAGDIIIDGTDIWGDGVNVAARLEALAEPGGICVSGRVQEDVHGKSRNRLRGHRRAAAQEHCAAGAGLPSTAQRRHQGGAGAAPP